MRLLLLTKLLSVQSWELEATTALIQQLSLKFMIVSARVSARWLHPQVQQHYLSQPSLEVGDFIEWHNGPLFQVLSEDLNLSTLDEPINRYTT